MIMRMMNGDDKKERLQKIKTKQGTSCPYASGKAPAHTPTLVTETLSNVSNSAYRKIFPFKRQHDYPDDLYTRYL